MLAITELQAQHLFPTKWPHMKFASKQNINHSSIPNEKSEIHFYSQNMIRKPFWNEAVSNFAIAQSQQNIAKTQKITFVNSALHKVICVSLKIF